MIYDLIRTRFFCLAPALMMAACATTSPPQPAPPQATTEEPAAPVFTLSELLGADPQTIDALLGAPDLTRQEGAGEYRRYALATCSLIVILYPGDGGAIRAAQIDSAALSSEEEKPDLDACLAAG